MGFLTPDFIFTSRTAVYAIRMYGAVGGALSNGRPYPYVVLCSLPILDYFELSINFPKKYPKTANDGIRVKKKVVSWLKPDNFSISVHT